MTKISDIVKTNRLYKKPSKILSDTELMELDKKLEKYRVVKQSKKFGKLSFIDDKKWLIDKKALSKNGAVILDIFLPSQEKECADCSPILYEELVNQYNQWCEWKGLKDYGVKKKLEQLELKEFGKI